MKKFKIHSSCHPHKSPPSAPLFHVHITCELPRSTFTSLGFPQELLRETFNLCKR